MHSTIIHQLFRHDQVARQVAKAFVEGVKWRAPPKQFVLKRDRNVARLLWNPKVNTTVWRTLHTWWSGRNSRRTSTDWAKKHKRHPVVLPTVVGTRGVIPNQTVASLAKLKAGGFDMQVPRLQKAAVKAV